MTKERVQELFELLTSRDNSQAYQALKAQERISAESNCLYPHMDKFIEMERSGNSYIRTRGLVLIACNAKWDVDGKIDRMIDEYLEHVTDERPICVRQCIKLLPLIAEAKPALVSKIVSALRDVNVACYADSMRPLIQNDIRDSLLAIEGQGSE
ncbi:MAG: SufBD protein [Eggerthellaceae bacterium]|nr:SufBD protein [Eggerthellaceae bacterium]